jgi:hypothetical protein
MKNNLPILVAVLFTAAAALTPAMAATKTRLQAKAKSQVTSQITPNDAATGEGEGVASEAPTGLSGQVATGNLDADFARDNNPSNGTATNLRPQSPSLNQQKANGLIPQD